jgi:hypothetical protein
MGHGLSTKTQYVTVTLTMRQLRCLDALVRKALEGVEVAVRSEQRGRAALSFEGMKKLEMTRCERGVISGVEKKLSTLLYQADVDRSIRTDRVKRLTAEQAKPASWAEYL